MLVKQTKNIGSKSRTNLSGYKNIDSTTISFGVAPRINACGKNGKSGRSARFILINRQNLSK
ncbi:MAG: hypothetical protein V8R81_07340 [Clostridia bacterium]